ncbi:hypothetical protein P4234_13160 [Pseudomonas aeruginosa]|nr:hypothetical protein [Pseudomonas aeruginosa]
MSQCNAEKRQCKTLTSCSSAGRGALPGAEHGLQLLHAEQRQEEAQVLPYPQRNFDFGDDCQDEYRSCYQSCGGTIRRIVHQD